MSRTPIGPARDAVRRCLMVALGVALAFGAQRVSAADGVNEVLVLYSTNRDAQIAVVGEREMPKTLEQGLGKGQILDYYSEYIDRARFPDEKYRNGFREFLRVKYNGRHFDLIIAMQDLALELIGGSRNDLFPGTPVVFFATSEATPRIPNSTAVIARLNFAATLDLASRMQPEVRNVFVVAGADEGSLEYVAVAREQFRRFAGRFAITYLTGLPTQQLEARLSTLPPNSIIYYLLVYRDGAGENFNPLDYVERLGRAANAPIYSWVDSTMDRRTVGGSLKSLVAEVDAVAALALRVLKGERADDVPITTRDLNINQVDWRELRRWGISEALLPPGTLVAYRQRSVWDRYGLYLLGALALLVAQSVLITGLLVQRTRRRQAEARVIGSQEALRTSYERIRDLGGRLLSAQETERSRIARELHDDISQQVALLSIDLELLDAKAAGAGQRLAVDALNRTQQIAKSLHDLSHRLHPAKLRLIGLVPAINGLRGELAQSGIAVTLTHENVPPALPPAVTLCLFRIVQEALQNALKHGRARKVSVDLRASTGALILTVVDDGVGFDVGAAWGRGLGLISMNERVEAIGGSMTIGSRPGSGTRLEVAVPVEAVEDAMGTGFRNADSA
jgi:signal transduction histidine kinase